MAPRSDAWNQSLVEGGDPLHYTHRYCNYGVDLHRRQKFRLTTDGGKPDKFESTTVSEVTRPLTHSSSCLSLACELRQCIVCLQLFQVCIYTILSREQIT